MTGSLPLHTAVLVNDVEIMKQLVHYKLILNKTDLTGELINMSASKK